MNWLRRQRIRYQLLRHRIPIRRWNNCTEKINIFSGLTRHDHIQLRELASLFLREKTFYAANGLDLTEEMRITIASQACLLILRLSLDYFDGWTEIVVYPGAFRVRRKQTDKLGIVHDAEHALSGESWLQGPVILSWDDIQRDLHEVHPGRNVVIHEFAHKLDMLNGVANGMPALHEPMVREEWTEAMSRAFSYLTRQISHHHRPCINAYAATDPAEFFAVISEYFFTAPQTLLQACPQVHHQLALFYRQDPSSLLHQQNGTNRI